MHDPIAAGRRTALRAVAVQGLVVALLAAGCLVAGPREALAVGLGGLALVLGNALSAVVALGACGQAETTGDDTGVDASTGPADGAALENWLLAIGNGPDTGSGSTHALAQISILPGEVGSLHGIVCPDLVFAGPNVTNDVVSGLTFYEGILYAVGATGGTASKPAAALYRIDPCQCTATKVGDFGPDFGLTYVLDGMAAMGQK